jgi:hypothetical protein
MSVSKSRVASTASSTATSNPAVGLRSFVDKPIRIDKVGDPLIDDFRDSMPKTVRGVLGFRQLFLALGGHREARIPVAELEAKISAFGLHYRPENLERLYRNLDREKKGQLPIGVFVSAVRPGMAMARKDFAIQAFTLIERCCTGAISGKPATVTLGDLLRLYDSQQHPEVLLGVMQPEEVKKEFAASWAVKESTVITKDEFLEYYADLSACIDSDDYFELLVRNAWHVSGGVGVSQCTTCLKVQVHFVDGRKSVVEVRNDLGLNTTDKSEIRKRLEHQGIHHIAEITLPPF